MWNFLHGLEALFNDRSICMGRDWSEHQIHVYYMTDICTTTYYQNFFVEYKRGRRRINLVGRHLDVDGRRRAGLYILLDNSTIILAFCSETERVCGSHPNVRPIRRSIVCCSSFFLCLSFLSSFDRKAKG